MAFGAHWEWRGFAEPALPSLARIRALPARYRSPQVLVDRYLWAPGTRLNIKLRQGELKLKRRGRREPDGVEEWREDPAESWPFPLPPQAVREVVEALGLDRPAPPGPVAAEEDLLDLLRIAQGPARVIEVAKERQGHVLARWPGVLIEVAQIVRPERVVSIGIEDPDPAAVRHVLKSLWLGGEVRESSYQAALEAWGRGESVTTV